MAWWILGDGVVEQESRKDTGAAPDRAARGARVGGGLAQDAGGGFSDGAA